MEDWLMALYMEAFIKILLALNFISRMNMQNFKVTLQFIMMTMAITVPMNPQWMEQLHLIYLLAAKEAEASPKSSPKRSFEQSVQKRFSYSHGAIIRGDTTQKKIALVFTGMNLQKEEISLPNIATTKIKASFFFTEILRNPAFQQHY